MEVVRVAGVRKLRRQMPLVVRILCSVAGILTLMLPAAVAADAIKRGGKLV
jgi:hypothetical protein